MTLTLRCWECYELHAILRCNYTASPVRHEITLKKALRNYGLNRAESVNFEEFPKFYDEMRQITSKNRHCVPSLATKAANSGTPSSNMPVLAIEAANSGNGYCIVPVLATIAANSGNECYNVPLLAAKAAERNLQP